MPSFVWLTLIYLHSFIYRIVYAFYTFILLLFVLYVLIISGICVLNKAHDDMVENLYGCSIGTDSKPIETQTVC